MVGGHIENFFHGGLPVRFPHALTYSTVTEPAQPGNLQGTVLAQIAILLRFEVQAPSEDVELNTQP